MGDVHLRGIDSADVWAGRITFCLIQTEDLSLLPEFRRIISVNGAALGKSNLRLGEASEG